MDIHVDIDKIATSIISAMLVAAGKKGFAYLKHLYVTFRAKNIGSGTSGLLKNVFFLDFNIENPYTA